MSNIDNKFGIAVISLDLSATACCAKTQRAFDAAGAATPAAVGFARKNGVTVEALQVREEGGGRYVFAIVRREGQPVLDVLPAALPGLVAGIKFGKTMRWNASNIAFSRPIRWFVSLWGEMIVPFAYAGLVAGRTTRGPAILNQGIRPDTLLIVGQFDHWATPYAKDIKAPSLNTVAPMSLELTDATGSGSDVVRVALRKVA